MDRDKKRRTRILVSALLLLLLPAWSLADDQAAPLPRWVVVHPAGDPFAAALKPLVAQRRSQQLDVRLLEAGDALEDQVAQACKSKGAVYLLLAGSWEKDAAALAMQKGLAEGPMSWLTFQLYDYGDGSGGGVPLADQRREHLEMWTLFGDPALRLPFPAADLKLSVRGDLQPNSEVEVRVEGLRLPAGADIELIAESRDAGAHRRPRFGATLARATAQSDGDSLRMQCQLPDKLPQQLLFRVTATHGKQTQLGLHLAISSTQP